MTEKSGFANFLTNMLKVGAPPERERPLPTQPTNVAGEALPEFNEAPPTDVHMLTVKQPDGRMSQYPPPEYWDDWVEWDGKAWPRKVARRYMLVPTVCFNCESGCGLLAYVDKKPWKSKSSRAIPSIPAAGGATAPKGPATHNQIYDPERILYPLKRVGDAAKASGSASPGTKRSTKSAPRCAPAARTTRRHHVPCRPSRRRRLHQPLHPSLGRRWPQQPHQHLLRRRARRLLPLGRFDRPSPDHANARAHLAHLQPSGNRPLLQPPRPAHHRRQDGGAKLITFDPRLSNTASMSDVWLPTWPGSEQSVLLAIANHLIQNDLYDKEFVRRWVNWEETLEA